MHNFDFSHLMDGYLLSSDFINLCKAFNFNKSDRESIKKHVIVRLDIENDEEKLIAEAIFHKLQEKSDYSKDIISKDILVKKIEDFYFHVYSWCGNEWYLIKSKLIKDVKSGKINSLYHLDLAFYFSLKLTDSFKYSYYSVYNLKKAFSNYIHFLEINYFLKNKNYSDNKKYFITKMLTDLKDCNPLYFNQIEEKFNEISKYEPKDFKEEFHEISNDNPCNLYEIVMKEPVSQEFFDLLCNLKLNLSKRFKIREDINQGLSVLNAIYNAFLDENKINKDKILPNDLKYMAQQLYYKSIMYFEENRWPKIINHLERKIKSNEIKSEFDLISEFENFVNVSDEIIMKGNLLYAQINFFLDFIDVDCEKFIKDLVYYVREDELLDYKVSEYYYKIIEEKYTSVVEKKNLDEDKFPAPRWLAFPDFSLDSKYWFTKDDLAYYYNAISDNLEIFPKPKIFSYNESELNEYEILPFRLMKWSENAKPKYFEIKMDCEVVNRFITLNQYDGFLSYNDFDFSSIKDALSICKVCYFKKFVGTKNPYDIVFEPDWSVSEEKEWKKHKYTVCLNATYLKFMNNKYLRDQLLKTGSKTLIYISDDEWGCDENFKGKNLFGFALMEVRDEIRKIFENDDKIDWGYTQYLKNRHLTNPLNNRPGIVSFNKTYNNLKSYVIDVDSVDLEKYPVGKIITNSEPKRATSKCGKLNKKVRFLIFSSNNHEIFEIPSKSKFKVIDKFEFNGKIQIVLLQLNDATFYFEKSFYHDEILADVSRKTFISLLNIFLG